MVAFHKAFIFLAMLIFLEMQLISASECPLDLSGSNFTLAASVCSTKEDRAKCCRYINALIAVSVARYANATSNLGVSSDLSDTCLHTITETLALHGVNRNASIFCGFGTKIPVNYECQGRTTVTQMIQSPKFHDVTANCRVPLTAKTDCKKCLNTGIAYLRDLVAASDNLTFSTCRDATFATLASQVDNMSTIDIAGCFFGVQEFLTSPVVGSSPSLVPPEASPNSPVADSPSQLTPGISAKENHHPYRLTLVPGIGIAVAVMAVMMVAVLAILIRRKRRELDDCDPVDKTTPKAFRQPSRKFQEGPSSMFKKFSYKETKKATNDFNAVIGQGGFGTVYKAEFNDGLVIAVKRMDKASEQAVDEFCTEIELLARLHHRHLVALRGFCIDKNERFLMYEYMANGSLKDHLHTPGRTPLSWRRRIQIAIDVANALEYLHFYCDPPLCHRDIKSSNILLDENFVAKVADFGLVHASKDGSICLEPINSDIKGTPGYMDPEYVITQEITDKSDVYSYGVVLLELVTGRRAIQDSKNLVEWSQEYLRSESMTAGLVDPSIGDSFDFDQLQAFVAIVRWCTQKEGRTRPSIKQVLRLLYDCADPMHDGFIQAIEDEDEDEHGDSDERGRISRGKMQKGDGIFHSGDARGLASSSSTTRSHGSRSFLLENGSPQSPHN